MSLESTSKAVFSSLVETIRSASILAGQDIEFYKNLDKDVAKQSDFVSDRILHLVNRLLSTVNSDDFQDLVDLDSVEENWKNISEVLDTLYEKTDIALDNRNTQSVMPSEQEQMTILTSAESTDVRKKLDLIKPQLKFDIKPDNNTGILFKPLLTDKPNALTPLDVSLHTQSNDEGILETYYEHPYKQEIEEQPFPDKSIKEPVMFTDWNQTNPIWIKDIDGLNAMMSQLVESDVIAVDLEHHDYRSYYGFVCLMQISTRQSDFIIDTLELRNELQVLNKVFTDPNIVKVFHGSHMDIVWLQRDFGLYVVSLFDTFWASKALGFPKHGLAYLLETYAHFKTSKKFQLADWRVRPLPSDMLRYAQADTHFLCYIYDILRNEAIKRNCLDLILEESKKMALSRYERLNMNPSPYRKILATYRVNPAQEIILQELYAWRDKLARDLDESPRYIMPNLLMISLSTQAPTTTAGVLNASNTSSPHVRTEAQELANLIGQAKRKAQEMDNFNEKQANLTEITSHEDIDYTLNSNYNKYIGIYRLYLNNQKYLFENKVLKSAEMKFGKKSSTFFGVNEDIWESKEMHIDRLDILKGLNLGNVGIDEFYEDNMGEENNDSGDESGDEVGVERGNEDIGNENVVSVDSKFGGENANKRVINGLSLSVEDSSAVPSTSTPSAVPSTSAATLSKTSKRKNKSRKNTGNNMSLSSNETQSTSSSNTASNDNSNPSTSSSDPKKKRKQLTIVSDNEKEIFFKKSTSSDLSDENIRKKPKKSNQPIISEYAKQNPILNSSNQIKDDNQINKKKKSFSSFISDMNPRPKKSNIKRSALKGQRSATFK